MPGLVKSAHHAANEGIGEIHFGDGLRNVQLASKLVLIRRSRVDQVELEDKASTRKVQSSKLIIIWWV